MNSQPNPETRWTPGAWLTLAVVGAWLVAILGTTLGAMSYLSDGWAHIRQGPDGLYRANAPITPSATALLADDVITAINGQPLTVYSVPPLPSSLVEGQTLTYTVQRVTLTAGAPVTATLQVPIKLMRVGISGYFYSLVWRIQNNPRDHIVATIAFLIVTFTFFMRPGNLGARYLFLIFGFYFVITVFGFAESALFEFTYHPLLTFLQQLGPSSWFWYFFPSITLMALSFPVVKAPLRRFPRLLPMLAYGLPGGFAFSAYTLVVINRDHGWMNLAVPVFIIAILSALVTILVTSIHNWLTIREPVARAQMRWLALGLGLGLGIPLSTLVVILMGNGRIGNEMNIIAWLFMLFPLSIVIAILRYRLFDIDVIIRRTLQYSLLSGLLGLTYFGLITVLQSFFRSFSGQQSEISIVLSTLAIAALFFPLRNRVQEFIDKRFYRKKYDAQKVLAEFAATCRDETDLDKLVARLAEVINETLQPEKVSVWIKPTAGDGRQIAVDAGERQT